ncbi:hypothetical protein L1049_008883 [Liquidambar formosana]|uniref:Uncharacterized protein n=1 Tax=Liquidambar formosana TaxID=63359 RepID=A0AAP0X2K7_LIQFO
MVASEAGLGAGASAAATFWTADTAMIIITTAKKSLIFMASIVSIFYLRSVELLFAKGGYEFETEKRTRMGTENSGWQMKDIYRCGGEEECRGYGQATRRDRCSNHMRCTRS